MVFARGGKFARWTPNITRASAYAHGIGVEQDLVQAYKWLNLAAAASHASAQRDKEILTDQMIPEAVAEGQRLSVEFQAAQ